jgi:hypothetical protein
MNSATTAEWVQQKMEAVFRKYPKPQVDRAYPVILLLMARDFGMENLDRTLRERVVTLLANIGVTEGMAEGEVKFRITRFVTCLEVNEQILTDIKEIFDEHYHALGESSAKKFVRTVLRRTNRRVAAENVPENVKGTVLGEELARKLKRSIRC